MCINKPWTPKTLSLGHQCFFVGLLLIDTDNCRPEKPTRDSQCYSFFLSLLQINVKNIYLSSLTANIFVMKSFFVKLKKKDKQNHFH